MISVLRNDLKNLAARNNFSEKKEIKLEKMKKENILFILQKEKQRPSRLFREN